MFSPDAAAPYPGHDPNPQCLPPPARLAACRHGIAANLFCFVLPLRGVMVCRFPRNVACYLLVRHFSVAEADRLQSPPRLLTDKFTTHLLLPRKLPGSAALLADFNRGLQRLKASAEHARLLKGVTCPRGW